MEFYFISYRMNQSDMMFQFPTGWNSTKGGESLSASNLSFNSQRDGILLKEGKIWAQATLVSIPNGMEFY